MLQRCNIYWIGKASTLIDSQKTKDYVTHSGHKQQYDATDTANVVVIGAVAVRFFTTLDCIMHFNVVPHASTALSCLRRW